MIGERFGIEFFIETFLRTPFPRTPPESFPLKHGKEFLSGMSGYSATEMGQAKRGPEAGQKYQIMRGVSR